MTYQKAKEEVIESSPQKTDAGKEELYLYSLRKMAEENVENNRTGLTNLHNINSFFYLCGEMIKQQPDKKYSVIIMDIVQFKAVNEFCGRDEGDRLLRFIASCFDWYENNRPDSYACHIRADIFCLCTSYEEVEELEIIVREIRKKITDFPFAYRVQPSFGIGISPERAPAISYLKDCATMAMNSIKGKVYRTYAVFDEKMRSQKMRERQVENDIVSALENGELQLYVQPKVDMRAGRVIGGEALVRWKHPEKGLVPPGEFIPVLEKNGFIINVDEYIWEKVFAYLGKLRKEGRTLIPVSINVSRLHAYDEKLTETLLRLREEYDVLPEYVPLELTESAFLEDEVGMYRRMESLRERGFLVSMDDFGTGYSTIEYVGDDGEPDGFDVALIKAVGEKLGMEVQVENMEFDSLVSSIGNRIDGAIAGMTVTDDRKEQVDFSDAYYEAVQFVIVPADSEIAAADDLKNKTIGCQLGTTGMFLAEDIEGATAQTYNRAIDAVNDLVNGRVDAVIIDKNPAEVFNTKFEGKVKIIDGADFGFEAEEYAIALPKGSELVEQVNQALADLKADGTFDALVAEYIGE